MFTKSFAAVTIVALLTTGAFAAVNNDTTSRFEVPFSSLPVQTNVWLVIGEFALNADGTNITIAPVEETKTEGAQDCINQATEFNIASQANFQGAVAYCIPLLVN